MAINLWQYTIRNCRNWGKRLWCRRALNTKLLSRNLLVKMTNCKPRCRMLSLTRSAHTFRLYLCWNNYDEWWKSYRCHYIVLLRLFYSLFHLIVDKKSYARRRPHKRSPKQNEIECWILNTNSGVDHIYSTFIQHEGIEQLNSKMTDGQTDNNTFAKKLRKADNYITDNLKYSKMVECLFLADVAKPYFSHSFITSQCLSVWLRDI